VRRRIVTAVVAVIAAALVAFAVPLGIAVRGLLENRALDDVQAQTEQVALFLDSRAGNCRELQGVVQVLSGGDGAPALAVFSRGDGRLLLDVEPPAPTAGPELARALRQGVAGRSHRAGALAVAVPLSTDVCVQQLVLHAERPDDDLMASVRRAWGALALLGIGVLVLAAGVGRWVAGRLARPLQDLAGSAAALGEGDFSVRVPRSDLPEVDAIAETLDRTAERLGRAVDRGRTFAADASHQLRTPLTALRLQLEGLEAAGVAPAEVAAALTEADRLEATVAELVALTSLDTAEEQVAADALVAPPVEAARVAARATGRDLALAVVPGPPVRTRPAAIRQALQVLLDNALQHGRGTVTVRVGPTLPDEPVPGAAAHRGLRICVSDEGPGPSPDAREALRAPDRGSRLPSSGGRGLALARTLVEGEGGRLTVDEDAEGRARTCLVLPVVEGPRGSGAPAGGGAQDPGGM
jgi:signal transduction histidine kinase